MKINNEREESIYVCDLDLTSEEQKILVERGLELIKKDETALIEYAVKKILEDCIITQSNKEDLIINKINKIKKEKKFKN